MVFNPRRQTEEEEVEGDYMMNIGVRGMLLTEKVAVLSFFFFFPLPVFTLSSSTLPPPPPHRCELIQFKLLLRLTMMMMM